MYFLYSIYLKQVFYKVKNPERRKKQRSCTRLLLFFLSSLKKKPHRTKFLPSTILDLAKNPEDVFKAPLNTTKLAPVTRKSRNKK